MTTRFLIFDAYGTLVELDDFYIRLQRGFAAKGVLLPLGTVTKAARKEMRYYISQTVFAREEADWIALKTQCADVLANAIREEEKSFDLPAKGVLPLLEDALVFRVFPEVISVLETFKARGIKMGVLSNWDFSLHRIFQSLRLSDYFSFILPSSEVGVQKPDRAFFDHALQLAQREYSDLQRCECCYIGDHYDGDVIGAREAGMMPVWLVRNERDVASGALHSDEGVLRIRDLRELTKLIV